MNNKYKIERLIAEQGDLRSNLVSYDKLLKNNNTTINIENTKLINEIKIILPIFLIFIFFFIHFSSVSTKDNQKRNTIK